MNEDEFNSVLDRRLERAFEEAFFIGTQQEESFWRRFTGETLPEKQAWIGFRVSMARIDVRLRQATRWTHWAAPNVAERLTEAA